MEFDFLLDPQRKLLSIGYRCHRRHARSELLRPARLRSAPGEFHRHRQGRHSGAPLVPARAARSRPIGAGAALVSWSGSMFEYLMPDLVLRAPGGSLLAQTSRLDRASGRSTTARELGLPWGISESAYNARDLELTYQYSNFGVPGPGPQARPVARTW